MYFPVTDWFNTISVIKSMANARQTENEEPSDFEKWVEGVMNLEPDFDFRENGWEKSLSAYSSPLPFIPTEPSGGELSDVSSLEIIAGQPVKAPGNDLHRARISKAKLLKLKGLLIEGGLIDEISDQDFVAHFQGKAYTSKINWLGFLYSLTFFYFYKKDEMFPVTLYSSKEGPRGELIIPHYFVKGKEIDIKSWDPSVSICF